VASFFGQIGFSPPAQVKTVRANEGRSDCATRVLSIVNERFGYFDEQGQLRRWVIDDKRLAQVLQVGGQKFRLHQDEAAPLMHMLQAENEWLRDLFSFAVAPDLVFYLRLGVQDLVPRVLEAGKMNYWESGMDMNYGDDLYDSFIAYQGELITQFDRMAEEYRFLTVDARQEPQAIQRQLRRMVLDYLQSSGYHAPPELAEIATLSKPPPAAKK